MSEVQEAPRLDARYVESTVHRLEARIRARFPDRRLGNAARELGRMVPAIHTGFDESKRRMRRVRNMTRATSAVIVVLVLVSSSCGPSRNASNAARC